MPTVKVLGGSSDVKTALIVSHMRLVLADKRSDDPRWVLRQFTKALRAVKEEDLY